ncbi:MAG: hypothetical protein ACRDYC_06135 [Acidimicrobiales bacterium]
MTIVAPLFGADSIDFAMLHKRSTAPTGTTNVHRDSSASCTGIDNRFVCGDPDDDLISTSYVERQNPTP